MVDLSPQSRRDNREICLSVGLLTAPPHLLDDDHQEVQNFPEDSSGSAFVDRVAFSAVQRFVQPRDIPLRRGFISGREQPPTKEFTIACDDVDGCNALTLWARFVRDPAKNIKGSNLS